MRARVACRLVTLGLMSAAACEPDAGSPDAGDAALEAVRDHAAEEVSVDAGAEDVPQFDVPVDASAGDVPQADVPADGSDPDAERDAERDARLPDSSGGCGTPLTIEELRDAVLALFGTED
jgi:hypothetical protein